MAEVANESKNAAPPAEITGDIPISSQGNGVHSFISSGCHRSLQVGGKGDNGQGSSSKTSIGLLFDDAIAAGYSQLRKVGISSGRIVRGVNAGQPWKGPIQPPRRSPPVTMGNFIDRARRGLLIRSSCRDQRELVTPSVPSKVQGGQNSEDLLVCRPGLAKACLPSAVTEMNNAHRGLPWFRRIL